MNFKKVIITIIKTLAALVFLSPFYIMIVYAFKSRRDIMITGLAFPKSFYLDNFISAIRTTNLGRAFGNTVIATVIMVFVSVLASSMAAYIISRKNTRFYNGMYFMFLAAIILPFQVIMLPMYRILHWMGLMNTLAGFIIAKSALEQGINVFLISSFVKTVPRELDDAAWVDGAGRMLTFWRIIFPLMKPVIMTIIVLNALALWNDLLAAQIILQSNRIRTLTLEQYSFISQYSTDLGKAFAAFMLSIFPIIALYFSLQKHIVSGIVAGAVKG